jgi:hypothetical protein
MALTVFPGSGIQPSPANPSFQLHVLTTVGTEDVSFAFFGTPNIGGTQGRPSSGIVWPRRLG